MNFRTGQPILCIDDIVRSGKRRGLKHRLITAGQVYTYRGIPEGRSLVEVDTAPTAAIEEVRNNQTGLDIGFYADRFRAIDDPSIELFREMCKTKPKVRERQD